MQKSPTAMLLKTTDTHKSSLTAEDAAETKELRKAIDGALKGEESTS